MKKVRFIIALAMILAMDMPSPAQNNKGTLGSLQSRNKKATATMTSTGNSKFVKVSNDFLVGIQNETVRLTDDGFVTLSSILNCDNVNFPSKSLVISSTNSSQLWHGDMWGGFDVQLPPGEYDMLAYFSGADTCSIVMKEQITITKDTTIEFNESDA